MDNLLTSFKRRVMKRDLLLTCLVFVRFLEIFVEEKLQWPTTVTAILKSSRLNQKAFGFCRELFGFVVKKTLCDLPTCWCVNYVSWSLKREKEVKNDSLKRFFVRPNENWYFLNKKIKYKRNHQWPRRDLNTQPSDLESDALPLRHGVPRENWRWNLYI